MKSLVAEVYCALKAQNNYGPQTTIGSHTDLLLLSVGISDTDWDANMPPRVFIQIRNLNDWWSYRKKHLNQIQLPSKMVNENHGLCQFYLKFPFWFHENIGLNASSFSYSPVKATLWLWKRWRIPLRKAKLYFGPSVWFCLQSSFTYLTLRKMLSDRFGSFSYQIKLTKFYQFLALSWRIYPPVGETQNNQHKKTPR